LQLVQLGLTGAAMFAADGSVLQPSEVLRKRSLIVQRGRFRPLTHVNMDILHAAQSQFDRSGDSGEQSALPIMEISMHSLREDSDVCLDDFVSRAEVIATTGSIVMVSDFPEYHRLAAYLCRYTNKRIGLAMGLSALEGLFEEAFYDVLDGGILESFGRLFKGQIQLLIYPRKHAASGEIECMNGLHFSDSRQHLLDYLQARDCIAPLEKVSHEYLDIHSPEVLEMISTDSGQWAQLVPDSVAAMIQERRLFGYSGP